MNIDVKGAICSNDYKRVYDWCGYTATCPNDVINKLNEANGADVDVYINSGGGEITSATEIYAALQAYRGNAKIHVTGIAASAASVIMCARECDISPTSMVMMHNVSTNAEGDYHTMEYTSDMLQTATKAMCQAYVVKTGKSEKEMLELMDKETWLTAKQAVEIGLCDKVTAEPVILVNSYCQTITSEQIRRYQNKKKAVQIQLNLLEVKNDKGNIYFRT